jgi:hypothetical protein
MPPAHIAEAKKKRAKRKGRPGKTTVGLVDRKPDGTPLAGHEARLASYVKRTLQLKRLDYSHGEVAAMIADEYKLESIPAITTIADWYKKGMSAIREDIEELQWQMRIEQFNQLEKLKRKWMPLALSDSLEIQRWAMQEGEPQPFMDENAIAEQIDATKQVVNIMARQAKLLGLDLAQATTKDGEGPGTVQDLQLWMIQQINVTGAATHGAPIDIATDILELRSGIPEIDQADSV